VRAYTVCLFCYSRTLFVAIYCQDYYSASSLSPSLSLSDSIYLSLFSEILVLLSSKFIPPLIYSYFSVCFSFSPSHSLSLLALPLSISLFPFILCSFPYPPSLPSTLLLSCSNRRSLSPEQTARNYTNKNKLL